MIQKIIKKIKKIIVFGLSTIYLLLNGYNSNLKILIN